MKRKIKKNRSGKNKSGKIRLGVNIDHVATLRQVRGGTTSYPDILQCASEVIRAGADQITIHLREDRRHIQDSDLDLLSKKLKSVKRKTKKYKVELNLEMAATFEMKKKAILTKPSIVCLVPEKREELTTEGGLDVDKRKDFFKLYISDLNQKKIPVSMFIEPSRKQVLASFEVGAQAVEFHTGKWVQLKGLEKKREFQRLCKAAELAHSLGLKVHAGHGLDYKTAKEILKMPYLEEVNIGHSIICYSLFNGIYDVVKKFKKILS